MIPTAEEQFKKYSNLYQFEEGSPEYLIDKEDFIEAVIELIKLHCIEEARVISERVTTKEVETGIGVYTDIDKDSILSAYPLDNIK